MAKTAAQRQASYRARRPHAGEDGNGERRLNLWVSTRTDLAIERLARRYCVTKREIVERLVSAMDDRIIATLDIDAPEWDQYFTGGRLWVDCRHQTTKAQWPLPNHKRPARPATAEAKRQRPDLTESSRSNSSVHRPRSTHDI
jgi:hypothetical protein